jgi:predicted RNA-binding Zn ribbon-like protein
MTRPVDDEQLLLDLLNTAPTVDGVVVDRLADDRAARSWLADHGEPKADRAGLAALRQARDALHAVVRDGEPAAALAPALRGVASRPELGPDGLSWTLAAPPGREPAARAVLAWAALSDGPASRVRPCANDECTLFLVDHSRANTARWCSMAGCGNRMKARRHYDRTREGD